MLDKVIILAIDERKHLWQNLINQVKDYFNLEAELFICGDGKHGVDYNWIDKSILPWGGWDYGSGEQSIRHFRAHVAP